MTRRVLAVTFCALVISSAIFSRAISSPGREKPQHEGTRLSSEEARRLKSPVPFTKESITRGRTVFARNCTACHGSDGKSQVDVVANATDLTDPKAWGSGTSEGEIFRSIRDGAGDTMPPFKSQLQKEEDIWHLVNFIRSLWPESMRPKLQ
ncbi:MAG TPA: cytochrome c [Blastocatellia bacterium]|nr:cytochrome c [Blastocatellia bacterium]